MVIQNNKMDDTVNTLYIMVKMAGANEKQHKRQGHTDRHWFDDQCNRGKNITGLSKKEH
jgi:hypothetical protein